MLSIWLGSLERYNDGELVGEWIQLPVDDEEMTANYNLYTNNGMHEYFIADYESDLGISIGEYDDPNKLNELARMLEDLEEWQLVVFKAAYTLREPRSIEETMDFIDDLDEYSLYPNVMDDDDLGCYYMDEFVPDKDSWLMGYIDTERLGHDLRLEAGGLHTEWGYVSQA